MVATADVEPGDPLTRAALGVEPMALSEELDAATFAEVEEAAGTIALVPLRAGQLVLRSGVRSALIDGQPIREPHEVTIPVDPARLPPSLSRGDRVTVLATDPGVGTHVAAADALVLRITAEGDTLGRAGAGRLTLSLDTPQATMQAAHLSFLDLTVVLTTRTDGETYPEFFPAPAAR